VWNGFNSTARWPGRSRRGPKRTSEPSLYDIVRDGRDHRRAGWWRHPRKRSRRPARKNTMVFYHHIPSQTAGCAWAGNCASRRARHRDVDGQATRPASRRRRSLRPTATTSRARTRTATSALRADISVHLRRQGTEAPASSSTPRDSLHWFEDDASKEIFGIKVCEPQDPDVESRASRRSRAVSVARSRAARRPTRPGFFPDWKVVVPDESDDLGSRIARRARSTE
jgi:hypothetical protein